MTKLPHYVLPLYPAIAILIAGILEPGGLSKNRWLVRGTVGWFLFPVAIAIAAVVAFIMFGRDLGLIAWPFGAAAAIFGLFAWWLYEVDGPERSLLRGMIASVFIAITTSDCLSLAAEHVPSALIAKGPTYAIAFPSLPKMFPSALIADELRATGCDDPHVASTYVYQEPSLVFCSAPIHASPTAPAPPNSCARAPAISR